MTKKEKEGQKEIYESMFLSESIIEYVKNLSNNMLKSGLKAAKKYCNIPVKNIEALRNQLQDHNFLSIERISLWEFSSIPVLNNDGNVYNFGYCHANYNIVNKWGHRRFYKCVQILYSDDFFVRWFGFELIDQPLFWVSVEKTVYRITYCHKLLWLYPSACSELESVTGLEPKILDSIVQKYERQLRGARGYPANIEKIIELDQCFKKGFFTRDQNMIFQKTSTTMEKFQKLKM
jgi:hypothetical protein